jgi:hypothetical protein
MHVIIVAEGYPEFFKNFEKTFNCKFYKEGNCKVRVREVKLYTVGFNECGKEEVLADLKGLFRVPSETPKNMEGSGFSMWQKIMKYSKWLRRLFPQIKPLDEDLAKIKDSGFIMNERKLGNHFQGSMYPVGWVKDGRYDDGSEIV